MRDAYIGIDHQHAKILRFSANHNGKRAVVKIEIEVTDHDVLAWILRDITRAQEQGNEVRAAVDAQAKAEKRKAPLAIGKQELLGLPYYGDRS
jgi:hypothetical protein